MATQYLMQAVSDDDGALYTWLAAAADFAGTGFPGPGSPVHIAVAEAAGDSEGGTPELSAVLTAGNETDGTNLEVTFLDKLIFDHPTPANVVEITHDDGLSIEVGEGGRSVFETAAGGSWVSLAGATANARYALATSGYSLRGLYRYDPVDNKVIIEAINGATGQMAGTWESPTFAESSFSLKVAPEDVQSLTDIADAADDSVTVSLGDDGIYLFTVAVIAVDESAAEYLIVRTLRGRLASGTLTLKDAVAIDDTDSSDVEVTYANSSGSLAVTVANNTGGTEAINATVATGWLFIPVPAAPTP